MQIKSTMLYPYIHIKMHNITKNLHTALHSHYTILHSHQQYKGSNFSTSLLTLVIFLLITFSTLCEVLSHGGFDLYFSDDCDVNHFFMYLVVYLYVFFGETSVQVLCLFFIWVVWGGFFVFVSFGFCLV